MRQRNIDNARVPARKCITIQNGIPPVTFNKTRAEVRAELGIAEDKIVAMTSGRAHAYKRIDLIIRSVYELKKLDPDNNVLFLFAGDGPDMQELTDLCKTLGIEGQFRLLGFRRDVKDLLGAADIAIHAALGEAFSLSITEYMGAGLPVLVPDIPSVSQAIDHGKNGFVYAKDSPEDIANFASKLAQDAALRKQLGDQAKQDSLSKYSMDQCTETLTEMAYTVIIENRLP